MLRCIAIDDEPLALELLEDNISKISYLQLEGSYTSSLEAMRRLQEHPVDLVFLDIQMPGLTGLQLIQTLPIKPLFILITAYEKYALDGYNLDVVDYLVKPVSLDRFVKACNKALELHQLKKGRKNEDDRPGYFFIHVDYSQVKINYSDIMWIEGLKDYIKIYLKSSSRPIVTRMSIKSMEDQLPADQFIRVQKSYIVSKDHITSIRKNCIYIGTNEIPVGENYKDAIDKITK